MTTGKAGLTLRAVEFRVLGPFEVVGDRGPVPIGGGRERAVLARLLISANQVVPSDLLIDEVLAGPGASSDGAVPALWVYVSRLRKALRPHGGGDAVITRPPGYMVVTAPDAIDSCRFERLAKRGRDLAASGDPAAAAAVLREALGLWRGSALADLADAPFARAEATRLEEARRSALEARIDADLAAGASSELIGELAALTGEHPLRERLWALRMTALYRAGRQAEALRTYQELRRRLGDELGIEPSPELRALETAILRQDAALHRPGAGPSATAAAAVGAGAGGSRAGALIPEPGDAVPLPAPLEYHQQSVFVRPEADMGRLEAAWEAARSGRRQLVLLAGEPGIGKTRRSAELARPAHAAGATVLYGRCDDGLGVPYQPFAEALGTYLRQTPAPILGRLGGELARLVPELAEQVPGLPPPLAADPETERYRLFDGMAAWVAAVAARAPTLLVLEDFHWATPPALAMLAHVVRSAEPVRLLVVVNYRDTELDVTPELTDAIADLLGQPGVDRIRLRGLDRVGVAAYLEAHARHELDSEGRRFADLLHRETAGNPFYLNQVLRHLSETGALRQAGGRWSPAGSAADIAVPDSVRDVIARRLARLPAETQAILALAAVQGDRFDLRVLIEAAGQPQLAVLRALDPAITARLVTEADGRLPGHRFVHALVRHTLYDGLSSARRMELHRAVGTALVGVAGDRWPDHAADLARHWLAATPHVGASPDEARRTLDYAQEAARRATASLAYEEAAAQLARALPLADLAGDPKRRAAILVALGEARHSAGDSSHRETLLEAGHLALELGDGPLAARAALVNQRTQTFMGVSDPGRVALLERVLAALCGNDSDARARVLVALATELHFTDDQRRHDLAREAVAVARRFDDPASLAHVLGLAGFALWEPATLGERMELSSELAELAEEIGDPVLDVNAGLAVYYTAAQHGDLDRARAALHRAGRAAADLAQPAFHLRTAYARASCAMLDGRFADAEQFATDALSHGLALGNPDATGIHHVQLGTVRLFQGRAPDAIVHMEKAAELLPAHLSVRSFLAWAYAETGRTADARAIIRSIGGATLSAVPLHAYTTLGTLTLLAGAGVALGDRDVARRLYDECRRFRGDLAVAQANGFGPVAYHLARLAALLGNTDEAERHFVAAVELQERSGARGLLVQTRLEWASLLLQRQEPGDTDRARALADAAAELAAELDVPVLAEQAHKLLAGTPQRTKQHSPRPSESGRA